MSQSVIGSHKFDLDTPILCIDLDIMEANIQKMSDYILSRGKTWRPHEKCHKTPAIALAQMGAGAIGVTCAKVSEAEVMAAAGVKDILIANMIVGKTKWERVVSLCRHARPIIACDHYAQIEPLAKMCADAGVVCRMMPEVNIGLNRVGSRPGQDTLDLAMAIDKLEGLELAGIMGYEGHLLQIQDQAEKEEKITEAMRTLVGCKTTIEAKGIPCEIVSAGGTGSYQITSNCEGITELQAGGGIFADPMYVNKCGLTGLDYSLSVLATVVSRPEKGRMVLDCGRKTMHPDFQLPLVKAWPDAEVTALSAEHCAVTLGPESQDLKIGDKIELIPGYADFTTILHENFYGFRKDRLEVVWPIQGRGKIQ
ncbi:D-threonine aldolase [Gimesia maris]|uniref:DSD1 family PLP-dependent enzyme n=1 Tax=Gimesia maris TaxID=122 RepID=UPI00118BE138|nr:DSD1 family PLP-dependent enzyme [Gimesia maris]QDT81096.1 D-threonine aldolase [Gimesia maris]